MTRLEIRIERLVLRGLPAEYANGLGELVEQRLTEIAAAGRTDEPAPGRAGRANRTEVGVADREALAAVVADRIWSASREGGMPR